MKTNVKKLRTQAQKVARFHKFKNPRIRKYKYVCVDSSGAVKVFTRKPSNKQGNSWFGAGYMETIGVATTDLATKNWYKILKRI